MGKIKKAVIETVTKTVTKTITTTKSSSNKGKGNVNQSKGKENVFDRKEPASVVKENVQIEARKGKKQEEVGTPILQMEELYETDEDDDDYVPEHIEEEPVESDDSLGDKELGSEDEEYMQARTNVRESIGVIGEMSLEKENEEERLSEYEDSDKERSDSSDSDGQVVRSKHHKAVYDPKGDIAEFKLVLGMRFEDGFQCKKALISWSIVKGHPIHFRRRFNIAIPAGRLYRAKAHALQVLRGTVQGHYNKLRSYIVELMRVDREGRFELLCGDGTIFQGLYIGFSTLKKGFLEGCRPILV